MTRSTNSGVSLFLAALLGAAFFHGRASGQEINFRASSLDVPRRRTGLEWARFNDDPYTDLLVADDLGIWIYFQQPGAGFSTEAGHVQRLEFGLSGALFDVADLDGDSISELIILHRSGVDVYEFDASSGELVKNPKALLEGMRGVPFQHLAPADFILDIDNDGDVDLIYPLDGKYYLYFQEDGVFTKQNQLTTRPISIRVTMGSDRLEDRIETAVAIPGLRFVDLNGDGRSDLRVRTEKRVAFFIQSDAGVIPEFPSYELDLSRFEEPRTGAGGGRRYGDQFQFIPRDLDDDGREDYTIVSGNRVWVFKANEDGVDFERPSQILKVSAENMSAALLELNGDSRPDLVIFKYKIPSLGRIVAGLAVGLRFELEVLGYDNVQDPVFSRRPNHRSTLIFKIPPLLKLLGELESIAAQFKDLESSARRIGSGDFNGDGRLDVIKLSEDLLELYVASGDGEGGAASLEESFDGDAFIQRVLFEERRKEVTLGTILSFATDIFSSFGEAAIAGRDPALQLAIDPDIALNCERIVCRDLNGDGRDDIIVFQSAEERGGDIEDAEEGDIEDAGQDDTQRIHTWFSVPSP